MDPNNNLLAPILFNFDTTKNKIDKIKDMFYAKEIVYSDEDELKCNVIFNIFLFILGFVGCAVTVIIKRTFFYYDIGAVLIATSALVFSINHPKWYILKPIEILGEKYSLDIFMLHIIIRDIVEQYRFETEIVYSYKWILLIILGSVLFGIIVRTAIDLMKKLINFIETKFEKKKSHT